MAIWGSFGQIDSSCSSAAVSQMIKVWIYCTFQDNVFVNVVASIQYRALAEKAADAYYKLSNTKAQIQAYVFDGLYRFTSVKLTNSFNVLEFNKQALI